MTTATTVMGDAPPPGRWAMAVRGFLTQNVAIGCAFGGFGVAVFHQPRVVIEHTVGIFVGFVGAVTKYRGNP